MFQIIFRDASQCQKAARAERCRFWSGALWDGFGVLLHLQNFLKWSGCSMKVGYVRTSTREQNTARQDVLMEKLGVEKVYTDKLSGKNTERPELQKMMDFVREGDVVVVESFSRFARNLRDLLDLTETLEKKDVQFISQKERIDTSGPAGRLW